jgi:L-amino acid N-acyltransferase YncA
MQKAERRQRRNFIAIQLTNVTCHSICKNGECGAYWGRAARDETTISIREIYTMSQILVRDSIDADMSAVQRIYTHYVLHGLGSFEEEPPSVVELKSRRNGVLGRRLPYLVAEIDGAVVGYSYAAPYRTRSAYRYTVEDSIYVDGDASARGVGRALLSTVIGHCEMGLWRQMIAVIGDSGNVASIALHESLGFRLVGTLRAVGFKHGRWVDSVLMQRPLGAGDRMPPP